MKIRAAIWIAALGCCGPAWAQDAINPDAGDPGDGTQIVVPQKPTKAKSAEPAASAAQGGSGTIQIDDAACRYAVEHVPSADTEYKPGVDVDGNQIAPADLAGGAPIKMPTKFVIPVSANLARGLHLPLALREDAIVGVITVDNGKLSFNGQPIGDDADADLAVLCRERK